MELLFWSLASKAGLLPTTRGFAGNIILRDIIIAVDNKPVSYFLLQLFFFLFMHSTLVVELLSCKTNNFHINEIKLSSTPLKLIYANVVVSTDSMEMKSFNFFYIALEVRVFFGSVV
ncbi:hypothetical protein L1049_003430 [Liquidambar formosana]|uniref:Uncharacterized protein n=1 Tax=Liquidambar formosana TaxID=63359 RepID=A0AAP0R3Z7_LIQFO